MGLRNPVSWLQQGSHPAENDRLTWQQIFSNTGVMGASSLAPTQQSTPNMSVQLAAGACAIIGTYQANMGVYLAFNDAPLNATITAAHPTLNRIDVVCLVVSDLAYQVGGTNTVSLQVIVGTPNAVPVAPGIPVNSLAIAQVYVGAAVTSIVTANITDVRVRTSTYEEVAGTGNPANTPFTIQLAPAHTGHALDIKNSAGVVIGYLDAAGVGHGALAGSLIPNQIAATQSLVVGNAYYVTTSSAWTLTLPASANVDDRIEIWDVSNTAATNNITVNSNGLKINGAVQNLTINVNSFRCFLRYLGSTIGWQVY